MKEKSYVGMFNCYFCGKTIGILLDRRLRDSLPRESVINMEPCDKCKGWMKDGIILISVKDNTSSRTGRMCVIKEEAFRRIVSDKSLVSWGIKKRFMFIADSVLDLIGLPTKEKENENFASHSSADV